jgi:hypothetical protein
MLKTGETLDAWIQRTNAANRERERRIDRDLARADPSSLKSITPDSVPVNRTTSFPPYAYTGACGFCGADAGAFDRRKCMPLGFLRGFLARCCVPTPFAFATLYNMAHDIDGMEIKCVAEWIRMHGTAPSMETRGRIAMCQSCMTWVNLRASNGEVGRAAEPSVEGGGPVPALVVPAPPRAISAGMHQLVVCDESDSEEDEEGTVSAPPAAGETACFPSPPPFVADELDSQWVFTNAGVECGAIGTEDTENGGGAGGSKLAGRKRKRGAAGASHNNSRGGGSESTRYTGEARRTAAKKMVAMIPMDMVMNLLHAPDKKCEPEYRRTVRLLTNLVGLPAGEGGKSRSTHIPLNPYGTRPSPILHGIGLELRHGVMDLRGSEGESITDRLKIAWCRMAGIPQVGFDVVLHGTPSLVDSPSTQVIANSATQAKAARRYARMQAGRSGYMECATDGWEMPSSGENTGG